MASIGMSIGGAAAATGAAIHGYLQEQRNGALGMQPVSSGTGRNRNRAERPREANVKGGTGTAQLWLTNQEYVTWQELNKKPFKRLF